MGQLKLENILYSVEEYLEIDKESKDRYEYQEGHIWAMAGTTTNHNILAQNLIIMCRAEIKGKGRKCKVFTESVRLEVNPKSAYYYPDLIFTCNPKDLQEKLTIRHPSLIIEILSEGSFFMDLSKKLDNYIQMPSLIYYVVVHQDQYKIRVWEKAEERWIYTTYSGVHDIVNLSQIDMQLPLVEVYEGLEIVESDEE